MVRRIWIITKKTKVTPTDRNNAAANNCPEISNGIPSALKNIIDLGSLPIAYEEPSSPEPIPSMSIHLARLVNVDPSKERPATVIRTWEGKEYPYECFVTENLKDQWLAGDVIVDDFILVQFLDQDPERVIAVHKVLKTW